MHAQKTEAPLHVGVFTDLEMGWRANVTKTFAKIEHATK